MSTFTRKPRITNQADSQGKQGSDSASQEELASIREIQQGIGSVAGEARFSIAAAQDMLSGRLTPQEASVLNTTAGRILKASELFLRFGRGRDTQLVLPSPE